MDWTKTQRTLAQAGYYPGAIDGDPGPGTWGALVGFAAHRKDAAVCLLRGRALARRPEWTSARRVCDFLSNVSHETGDFTRLRENLNYTTVAQIRKTWPSRFPSDASAMPYVRNPVALANKVYARPEEGNTRPGDGWLFRGGGDIQVTFANGYRRASTGLGIDLYAEPDRISEPGVSILTALGWYRRCELWEKCDAGQHTVVRSIINTGKASTPYSNIIGMDDVDKRRDRLLGLFN